MNKKFLSVQFEKRLLILLSFAGENLINTFYKRLKIESMEVVSPLLGFCKRRL